LTTVTIPRKCVKNPVVYSPKSGNGAGRLPLYVAALDSQRPKSTACPFNGEPGVRPLVN